MRVAAVPAFLIVLGTALSAQSTGPLAIRSARRDTIVAGATVTAAFMISSQRDDSTTVLPRVEAPADWTILMGMAPLALGPRASELVMLSVAVPSRAAAGTYSIRLSAAIAQDKRVMDSLVVTVPQRRAMELGLIDKPGYVVSGKTYRAAFLVRNRGNVATTVKLTVRSSLGDAMVTDSVVSLEPDQSRVIGASVATPAGLPAATDDVLEIAARVADTFEQTEASSRVTIVPEPGRQIDEFLRVPTQIRLRAANTDAVSPFELFGRGAVRDGGSTQLDFLMRGPTGPYSAFGERDEYRVELSAPSWRVRAGDHLYMLSPLTGSAQPGFGGGLDATRGIFAAGGYGQQFRRLPEKGSETGAFVSARPTADSRLALNLVSRAGGFFSGQVGSASASLSRGAYDAEVEFARSHALGVAGNARTARVSGGTSVASYDLGHLFADTGFTGSQRGSEHDYLTASMQYWEAVSFTLNASTHRTDLSRSTGVPYLERFDVGTLAATFLNRFTVEVGAVARGTTIQGAHLRGAQRGVRARGDQDLPFGTISLEVEGGRAREPDASARTYSDVSLGLHRGLPVGALSIWADRYSGGSITKGSDGTVTVGGDASLRVRRTTDVMLMAYATQVQSLPGEWHSQLDAQISHTLPNGNTVALRARLIGGGSLPSAEQSVAYLEYGVPLRLPVSRLRTRGRVYGRVVDAATGRGVPGALVRLGPQVAITDKQGQVAFGGVPGGEHRVSMSQETSFANAVFVGDPTLRVDSTRTQPTTFELAIARSARVDISVRRFSAIRTSVAGAADSLSDAGPVVNATLILVGNRDTLYRTTSDDGSVSFTDIPPGRWAITIRGDAPAFHRFDPDRLEIDLAQGDAKAVTFRLVPRKREVQLIGDGQELRPTAAEAKPAAPTPPIKTGKPNDRPKQ